MELINKLDLKYYIHNYYFSKFKCAVSVIQGIRKEMLDNYLIESDEDCIIFGIFDGHGSNIFSQDLKKYIFDIKNSLSKNTYIINKLFISIDKILYKKYKFLNGGTTCTLVYIFKNIYKIIFINLGDSKAIYIKDCNILYETPIFRPNLNKEKYRILNNNFKITNFNNISRINSSLSLSRSFGDFKYKLVNNKYNGFNSAVICIPSVHKINIINNTYIIIASDGFWDYTNYEDILKILHNNKNISQKIELLIKLAINNYSKDNIALILVNIE